MLTLKQFTAMADSYGADLHRWPESQRREAEALLDQSEKARAIFAEALILDEELRSATAREDAALWRPGEQDAALARLRSGVAARIAAQPTKHRVAWPLSSRRLFDVYPAWLGLAGTSSVAIIVGLLLGAAYSTPSAPASLLTMLQPGPIQILTD